MTASDTASSAPDTDGSVSFSGTGWPAADAEEPEARWDEPRASAYRQLWQPPGRRPRPHQALGGPYVWDGRQVGLPAEREGSQGPATSDEQAVSGYDGASMRDTVIADEIGTRYDAGTEHFFRTANGMRPGEHAIGADRIAGVGRTAAAEGADALSGIFTLSERAVIGDELRQLAAWCQMGACIARHTDADALGEADIRAKAVAAGWCVDLFGRLICPSCQQIHPVWSARPAIRRDLPAALRDLAAEPQQRPGSWPVSGAGFQIGRHRRTYGVGSYVGGGGVF